jgi:hypothetical protein
MMAEGMTLLRSQSIDIDALEMTSVREPAESNYSLALSKFARDSPKEPSPSAQVEVIYFELSYRGPLSQPMPPPSRFQRIKYPQSNSV